MLASQEYLAGLVDFTTVLDAQRARRSLEDQLAQSDGSVTANLVRLYKTLGGGWSSSLLQADPRVAEKRIEDNE